MRAAYLFVQQLNVQALTVYRAIDHAKARIGEFFGDGFNELIIFVIGFGTGWTEDTFRRPRSGHALKTFNKLRLDLKKFSMIRESAKYRWPMSCQDGKYHNRR